jgi:hypothetical protein
MELKLKHFVPAPANRDVRTNSISLRIERELKIGASRGSELNIHGTQRTKLSGREPAGEARRQAVRLSVGLGGIG